MKIENLAPEYQEIALTTKNYFIVISRTMDGKVHVQVIGRKTGSSIQHLILGELLAPNKLVGLAPCKEQLKKAHQPIHIQEIREPEDE
jgi:hypothetical protein